MESVNYSQRSRNPLDEANFLSKLFFWWTYNVLKKGRHKPYEIEDLPDTVSQDHSHLLGNKLEQSWFSEMKASKQGRKPSLLRALWKIFWKEFICIAILHSVNDFFVGIWKQMILGLFLVYVKESKTDPNAMVKLKWTGATLVLFFAMNSLLQNHFLSKSYQLGARMKVALSSLVYRKCLRLGSCSSESASAGRVVNLLSNDLRQFDHIIMFCCYMWSGVFATIIILVLISRIIGVYPVIACLASIICAMPVQILVSKALARNRIRTAYASDKRIQIMDEIIGGIQIIKMYAWEIPYEQLIKVLRGTEMKLVRKSIYLRGFQVAINLFISKFTLYLLIVGYALTGEPVLPEKVFLLVGYCALFARILCGMSFRSFGECSQCLISIKRLQAFLEVKEFEKPSSTNIRIQENAIQLFGVAANWSYDSNRHALKEITLNIRSESLTTVIGEVGSGKSSLLNVILGELPIQEGNLQVNGLVSYYCQSPWIFPGTIRQNVLFAENFEKSRYERVIEVCALKADFKILQNGDLTLVGERGVTLSGGQKARIALARDSLICKRWPYAVSDKETFDSQVQALDDQKALYYFLSPTVFCQKECATVYKRADIYLLDDPLSAVDASVSKHIFDECISGFLAEKTRILVTHQLQFLMTSNSIVLLHEGKVAANGSFHEIMNSEAKYIETLKSLSLHGEDAKTKEDVPYSKHKEKHRGSEIQEEQLVEKELEREDNTKAKRNALIRYMVQGAGVFGISIVFFLCILTQLVFMSFDLWLKQWTTYSAKNETEKNATSATNWTFLFTPVTPSQYYIAVYTVLVISVFVFVFTRNICFAYCGQKCAKAIHAKAVHGVVYTNSSFFNNNPSGRILNRFSKDMGAVDDPLLTCLLDAVTAMLQVIGAFIISASINLGFLPPATIAFVSLFIIRKYYIKVSRNLKRLESVAKSPVFVHVHSTLQGLPTIRTSKAASKLVEEFDQCQDVHMSVWFLYNFSSFGYSFALDCVGVTYMAILVIGTFFLELTGSEIGLSLAQVSVLLNFTQWALTRTAEVSNQVTSIDRLLKYALLPPESRLQEKVDETLSDEWPSKGRICFENVSLRYNPTSPPSMDNVSLLIQPQEKVGIVGRTGAGKTSLISALFRLAYVDGSIKIDDVDTTSVPLDKLRSRISVIPQDPVLFSGSIRKNLDPFGEHDDAALWNALEEAELKKSLTDADGAGLNTIVTQGGKNFSVGQRQLICLARAILRNNKILVLDEATANVDQKTDHIIQKTIREKFKSCTVLTIAHRLNTVVDSDKILVMNNGTAAEYDQPYELLKWEDGHFYRLVAETGDAVAATLTEIAKEKYNSRQNDKPILTNTKE